MRFLILAGGLIAGLGTLFAEVPEGLQHFVDQHCLECHDRDQAEGGLDLESLNFELSNEETARLWVLAHDRVAAGEMPPAKKKEQPEKAQRGAFLEKLGGEIVAAEKQRADVVLRRLNRNEYENTVRDLFAADVQIEGLPDDTSTDGFDNVGEGLAVSAEAMQAYLEVADRVLDTVFGPPSEPKRIRHETNLNAQVDWRGNALTGQYWKMFRKTEDGLVIFSSRYNPSNLQNFSRLRAPAGTYRAQFKVRAINSETPVTLRIYGGDTIVNRRERHLVGYYDIAPGKWTTLEFEDRLVESGGTFLPKCYGTEDIRDKADTTTKPGIEIGDIVIEGPLEEWPPKSRALLLGELDLESAKESDAEAILEKILPQAFRRPVTPQEVDRYLKLFQNARAEDRSFEASLKLSLKAMLCSPDFLFLNEPDGDELTQQAFANRLAYFLWSSMPDKELLAAELSKPAVLRAQVERMLGDSKATEFIENFTGQWLDLRDIDFTEPDANLYPEFDELLRLSMVQETQLFFRELLTEDQSIGHFIESDFTFVNERLAFHYGIEGVTGQAFRKVQLPADSVRGGLLTQASILKVTANGTNTSPVVRGVWVLDNILGTPSSPPPDNVGSIEPDIRGATTIREQLAKHREIKSCAACHDKIDPLGYALESFDPIGAHRDRYRTMAETAQRPDYKRAPYTWAWVRFRLGQPIESQGQLSDGRKFQDVRELKKQLASDPDQLARNLTRKLLTYGLGRKVGFADRPAVEEIVDQVGEEGYGLRSLLHAVIQSETFRQP